MNVSSVLLPHPTSPVCRLFFFSKTLFMIRRKNASYIQAFLKFRYPPHPLHSIHRLL
jgi:hypothetical protein